MRSKIHTLAKAMSTLVVLFVLVFGASLEVAAQGRSRWGRSHNRGNHYGWSRGRRVGQQRNANWWRWRRHAVRRDRRDDRRDWRRDRRDWRRDHRSDRRNRWRDRHGR